MIVFSPNRQTFLKFHFLIPTDPEPRMETQVFWSIHKPTTILIHHHLPICLFAPTFQKIHQLISKAAAGNPGQSDKPPQKMAIWYKLPTWLNTSVATGHAGEHQSYPVAQTDRNIYQYPKILGCTLQWILVMPSLLVLHTPVHTTNIEKPSCKIHFVLVSLKNISCFSTKVPVYITCINLLYIHGKTWCQHQPHIWQ